jgi:hypothetical protein
MKATHLMFFDTDMIFPADALTRLLPHNKDIVGATYSKRMPPFHPLAVNEEGQQANFVKGLHRVKSMPTGCLLISTNVFNKLSKPYFNLVAEGDQLRGEDYYFCEKARAAGFEIWCDGNLSAELGHIGQKINRLVEQNTGA